ncbi:MAG TPA: LptF/LptG family permease [Bacteroidales bacterium]|nr:LptF/LptG family permease [Bacteroidales bacterium]HSA43452.1 LptF/LptG family permease [Bacteroidales bacterium]
MKQRDALKTLDQYIIRKFLGTFFYAISLIIVIVIIFDFSEKVDDFIDHQAPLKAILFDYYLNFIPYFVNLFSPLFTFIAVIFFTAKMATHTEIVAILSSGISFNRFLRPYLISSLILAILSFGLANFLIPYTNVKMLNFENRYVKNPKQGTSIDMHMQLSPGVFVYIEGYNKREDAGYRFTLEKINESGLYYKLTAEVIKWNKEKSNWELNTYHIRHIDGLHETLTRGAKLDTMLNFTPADIKVSVENAKTMKFRQLRRFIEQEKMRGTENVLEFEVEKHKRIAFPFATIVLTFIGVSLSSRKVRGGIGLHLGSGIAISFAFILFMQVSTTFAIYGNLSPLVASWIPNLLFGLLGIYLIRRAPK